MLKGLTKYVLLITMATASVYPNTTGKEIKEGVQSKEVNRVLDRILEIEDNSDMIKAELQAFMENEGSLFENAQLFNKVVDEIERRKAAEEAERLRLEEEARLEAERIEAERIRMENMRVVFNPYDLTTPSNLTREKAYKMLEGSALQTLSNAYVYMEELYGINAVFLIALTTEESGHGRSSLAISHNNLGGIKNSSGGWRYFDSWGTCLDYIARLITKQYLSEDGAYYNGKSIWNVNVKYCEQSTWSSNISSIANTYLNKIQ